MYTNIPTHMALNLIGKYLTQYQRKHNNTYPQDAVRAGLRLIMTLNIFTFGDLIFKELNGTVQGTPPDEDSSMTPLAYEFSERSKTVDFMDMTITLNNSNMIDTTLFEKRLNLHLYIPPHSAHPPRLLPGIVYIIQFHIFTLCSCDTDKLLRTKVFFKR